MPPSTGPDSTGAGSTGSGSTGPDSTGRSSTGSEYAKRLQRLQSARWKRYVPNPYRFHIRRVCRGEVLEVGCGIGRCLGYLRGRVFGAVGVDPNGDAVATARSGGLQAFTIEEFDVASEQRRFDTLLISHVLEHLTATERSELLGQWLPLVRPGGRVVLICPQQRGYASDATHVEYVTAEMLAELCRSHGLVAVEARSFPLPASFGRLWVYNETVVVAHTADQDAGTADRFR